jgi:hypothetical protein
MYFCCSFVDAPKETTQLKEQSFTDQKKKTKFSSHIRKFYGIGCKVIYVQGLPNIRGNEQIFNHMRGLRRPIVIYDFAADPV